MSLERFRILVLPHLGLLSSRRTFDLWFPRGWPDFSTDEEVLENGRAAAPEGGNPGEGAFSNNPLVGGMVRPRAKEDEGKDVQREKRGTWRRKRRWPLNSFVTAGGATVTGTFAKALDPGSAVGPCRAILTPLQES